jgi:hypothetical protein
MAVRCFGIKLVDKSSSSREELSFVVEKTAHLFFSDIADVSPHHEPGKVCDLRVLHDHLDGSFPVSVDLSSDTIAVGLIRWEVIGVLVPRAVNLGHHVVTFFDPSFPIVVIATFFCEVF